QCEMPVMPGTSLRPPTRYQTQNEATGAWWSSRVRTMSPFGSRVSRTSCMVGSVDHVPSGRTRGYRLYSFLSGLECSSCGRPHDVEAPQTVCAACGKVLFARYDLEAARRALDRAALAAREPTLWRYHELLPVRDPANVATLGEGFTPLLA